METLVKNGLIGKQKSLELINSCWEVRKLKPFFSSCSHGFTVMTNEEIKSDYGETKKWPMFSELKEKVHNGGMW